MKSIPEGHVDAQAFEREQRLPLGDDAVDDRTLVEKIRET